MIIELEQNDKRITIMHDVDIIYYEDGFIEIEFIDGAITIIRNDCISKMLIKS